MGTWPQGVLDRQQALIPTTMAGTIYSRIAYFTVAKLAEQAERYDDVAESIKDIAIHIDARLTIDERSLLSVAYKMKSNSLRTALRLTTKLSNAPSNTPRQVKLGEAECRRIERELAIVCEDVVALLKTRLMPGAADHGEERVFLLKMLGDYYRYLAECSKENRDEYIQGALSSYTSAYKEGLRSMEPLHPTRLGVALNFAVFYHDCKESPIRACYLAKQALDDAVVALLVWKGTESLHDAFVILQLLKDDLVLCIGRGRSPPCDQFLNRRSRRFRSVLAIVGNHAMRIFPHLLERTWQLRAWGRRGSHPRRP